MLSNHVEFPSLSEAALYLWEYFYLCIYHHCPTESEAGAWRRIECATIRIRESEQLLGDRYPAAVRVKNARRIRRATREIFRLTTEKLEDTPDLKVAEALGMLEGCAQRLIDLHEKEAKEQPLH